MARRIGNYDRETSTPAMNKMYDFLNAELPDYITAGYSLVVNGKAIREENFPDCLGRFRNQ